MTDTKLPTITIVIPSYNQARFIGETLRSLVDQHYPNMELIVIDGGSTDGSVDIIRDFKQHIAYWVSEPDGGQTDALIKGFSRSSGDIQCWLNSDDLHESNTLQTVAEFFMTHRGANFVFGNCSWITPDGSLLFHRREMGFHRWIWLYAYNYIAQPAAFWTRDLYQAVGGLDPTFVLAMDTDLFARFSRVTKLHHIDMPLARFRYYQQQRNQNQRSESNGEDMRILAREMGRHVSRSEKVAVGLAARAIRYSYRGLFLTRALTGKRL